MMDEKLFGKRAALYVRVSSEEQALRGYSLEAQLADLEAFAKENEMLVVGKYVDAGTTARKKLQNRKEFQRMLQDVQANKIDVILFIKLDRWFRNVADYYEVQKVLDAHGVTWKCTQEFYDTTTANGRLNLNIKLSIAQDEADRTSERIKFVQENKVRNGEVISGSVPYGLSIDRSDGKKRISIDEERIKVVQEAFDYYATCHSRRKVRFFISDKYGVNWTDQSFKKMIYNDLYAGEYRGNTNYCPAAFEKSYLLQLRSICEKYSQHSRTGVHCYLFSGILRCDTCGDLMHGVADPLKDGGYTYYYRCSKRFNRHKCTNSCTVRESVIEESLLNNLTSYLKGQLIRYEAAQKQAKKPQADKAKIKTKIRRLKDLYVNEVIDLQDYKRDYDMYMQQLESIQEPEPLTINIERIRSLLTCDFESLYTNLDREHKRAFWRSILSEIRITDQREILPPIFL